VLEDESAPRSGRAVDVACGSGRDATYLALAGLEIVGVDILPDALEKARELAESARRPVPTLHVPLWVRADLEKAWPFPPSSFDLVVCVRFLWRALLPALAASLRPGGSLVYETFTDRQRRHRVIDHLEAKANCAALDHLGSRSCATTRPIPRSPAPRACGRGAAAIDGPLASPNTAGMIRLVGSPSATASSPRWTISISKCARHSVWLPGPKRRRQDDTIKPLTTPCRRRATFLGPHSIVSEH
jgi:SAM-dependent methyltransferase